MLSSEEMLGMIKKQYKVSGHICIDDIQNTSHTNVIVPEGSVIEIQKFLVAENGPYHVVLECLDGIVGHAYVQDLEKWISSGTLKEITEVKRK